MEALLTLALLNVSWPEAALEICSASGVAVVNVEHF